MNKHALILFLIAGMLYGSVFNGCRRADERVDKHPKSAPTSTFYKTSKTSDALRRMIYDTTQRLLADERNKVCVEADTCMKPAVLIESICRACSVSWEYDGNVSASDPLFIKQGRYSCPELIQRLRDCGIVYSIEPDGLRWSKMDEAKTTSQPTTRGCS